MSRDRRTSFRLLAFTFCVTSSYMLNRIIGDSLLLARLGPEALPVMLVLGALIVGAISYVWARRSRDAAVRVLLYETQLGGTAITLLLVTLLPYLPTNVFVIGAVYVLAELRGCFNLILISTLLNEHFCARTEKGRYAFVNAGSPVAGIVVGAFVGIGADSIPPGYLLGFCCVLDVIAVVVASGVVSRRTVAARQTFPAHFPPGLVNPGSIRSPDLEKRLRTFVQALVIVVVSKTIVLSIVGFEWRVVADRALGHDEQALQRYFGLFYAIADGLILTIQLVFTRTIINRLGIRLSLLILPLTLVLAGMFSLVTKDASLLLIALTVARGSIVLRRSIHDVAVQLIYGAMPTRVRRGVVARILGIAKPIAEAAAAGLVAAFAFVVPVGTFAWFWMPFLAVWLYWTLRLGAAWKRVQDSNEA